MRPPEPAFSSDAPNAVGSESGLTHRIIHVPTRKVGYLIGHAGRTIFGFERQTGAKIDIMTPKSRNPETPVALVGTPHAVRHVIRMIMDLYGSNNLSSQLWRDNRRDEVSGERRREVLATEEIQINPDLVGPLIGDSGEVIESIEKETGAKIVIHQDQEEVHLTPVDVTGTAEQNSAALKLLKEKLAELGSSATFVMSSSASAFQHQYHHFGGGGGMRRGYPSYAMPPSAITAAAAAAGGGFARKKLWTTDCLKPKFSSCSRKRKWSDDSLSPPAAAGVMFDHSHHHPSRPVMGGGPHHHPPMGAVPQFPLPFMGSRFIPAGGAEVVQPRYTKESIFAIAEELECVDLSVVCKRNLVRAEVVKVPQDKLGTTSSSPRSGRSELKELVISGIESNVQNAKLDIIREFVRFENNNNVKVKC